MDREIYPSYKIFREQWKSYSVIPILLRFPFKIQDIFPLYLNLCQDLKENFLLDGSGRYAFFPLKSPVNHFVAHSFSEAKKIWSSLESAFKKYQGPGLPINFPPFYGGAVGVLSYDAGRIFEKGWKSPPPPDPLKLPLIDFYIYDDLVCHDRNTQEIFIISCLKNDFKESYEKKIKELIRLKDLLVHHFKSVRHSGESRNPAKLYTLRDSGFRRNDNSLAKGSYLRSVKKIKKYIAQGDIYQANLSQRIEWESKLTAEEFYGNLRSINPSPYSCLWKTPSYSIASCSPELLLKKRGSFLETRPIAGTRPRGEDQKRDQILEGELLLNEKERAEHIMLVDLERNDLGRVSIEGTVHVEKNMTIEKYSHVMHIVSCVEGQIKKSCNFFNALEALFPGGTITGCPKIRCMEILDELEPVRRAIFYGSLGWVGYNGDGEMNILIRSATIQKNKFTIQAGSGIVADSDPEFEFQESLHKARALLLASKSI